MFTLGIYHTLYGDTPMTAGRALLIAAAGFLIVFAILALIAVFVKLLGKGFDAAAKKKRDLPAPAAPDIPVAAAPEAPPLPDGTSAGTLVLTDVTEEEAAMVMAIVSDRSGIPLNRLQFRSIRKLEDEA